MRRDIGELGSHLDEVERLRSEGVIGGPERNAADFQIAASVRSLAKLADLEDRVRSHPAAEWAATVVPALPGPVPRALPAEWLRPLAQ